MKIRFLLVVALAITAVGYVPADAGDAGGKANYSDGRVRAVPLGAAKAGDKVPTTADSLAGLLAPIKAKEEELKKLATPSRLDRSKFSVPLDAAIATEKKIQEAAAARLHALELFAALKAESAKLPGKLDLLHSCSVETSKASNRRSSG